MCILYNLYKSTENQEIKNIIYTLAVKRLNRASCI